MMTTCDASPTSADIPDVPMARADRARPPALWLVPLLVGLMMLCLGQALDWVRNEQPARPLWMIGFDIGGVVLVLVVVAGLVLRHRRIQAEQRRYLAALESLNRVSAAINARVGESPAVLTELAEAARSLLGMAVGCVLVVEPDGQTGRIIAISGAARVPVGELYPLETAPALRACVMHGRTIVVEDALRLDPQQMDVALMNRHHTRAMLMAPMLAEGRILGALALTNELPRRISAADRRLAELWASQAAVILQNQAMYERLQGALQDQRRLQAQRETLVTLSLSLYGGESLETALQGLADHAPALLGVDLVCVAQLVDQVPPQWVLTAVTDTPLGRRMRGRHISGTAMLATQALQQREPVEVADVEAEPRINRELARALRARSLLFVPLNARDGTPIAMMTLIRHRSAPFTAEQRQMAQYLSTRCGAALELAALHQRALADAQTKAFLLRELHHRVKNNLAGIAGLLSINQPELPDAAQQWLGRVTDRIRAMARAHEVFTAGPNSLKLSELVQVVLSSVPVVQPGSLRIETSVEKANVMLRPERAVALVMVLHELCHNAVVHGLGEHGVLKIDAQMLPLRQLVITVTDDGSSPVEAIPHLSSGMGLGLVQGLVKRELRGQFALRPAAGGGSAAVVQFRLLDGEAGNRMEQ